MPVLAKRYCDYTTDCYGYNFPYAGIAGIVIAVIVLIVISSAIRRRRMQRRFNTNGNIIRPTAVTMQSGSFAPQQGNVAMYPMNPAPVYQPNEGYTSYMPPSEPPPPLQRDASPQGGSTTPAAAPVPYTTSFEPPPYEPRKKTQDTEIPNLVT